jgi:hypothetical protein
MIIDDKTYQLPNQNYIPIVSNKEQIIIGHTFNHNMRHYNGWLKRYNGNYKKTAAFTISAAGLVYQHFNPIFYSNYFREYQTNSKSIVILLENDGWLIKDSKNNEFITWIGDIYNEPSKVVEKRWRGYNFWAPYTKEQFESVTELVKSLCDEFNIPLTTIGHNTKVDKLTDYKGIMYKSNMEKHHTDINPSWDCESFKTKIENYGKQY